MYTWEIIQDEAVRKHEPASFLKYSLGRETVMFCEEVTGQRHFRLGCSLLRNLK